jgi:hypothetical protein
MEKGKEIAVIETEGQNVQELRSFFKKIDGEYEPGGKRKFSIKIKPDGAIEMIPFDFVEPYGGIVKIKGNKIWTKKDLAPAIEHFLAAEEILFKTETRRFPSAVKALNAFLDS